MPDMMQIRLVTLLAFAVAVGCGSGHLELGSDVASAPAQDATADATLDAYLQPAPWVAQVLAGADPRALSGDSLWALAQCGCASTAAQAWLTASVNKPGALPEVLTPDVRSAIRGNSMLKNLFSSGFGAGLAGLLIDNQTLLSNIRGVLWQRLTGALRPGAPASAAPAFNLDGFQASAGTPSSFAVEPQTAAWQLILAAPPLWGASAAAPSAGVDAQAVHLMRLFSEWQYLFGLSTTKGPAFGGLTLGLAGTGPLASFDPRIPDRPARLITGTYTVSYPSDSALTLAESAKESWAHPDGPVLLKEQAQLWLNAATALHRTRPRNRGASAALFGDVGLLPADAYLLPLAFLDGMQSMLSGVFIDKTAQLLRDEAGTDRQAALASAVRLGLALQAWNLELADTADLTLVSSALQAKIAAGLPDLQDALRLTVSSVVNDPRLTAGGAVADVAEAYALVSEVERGPLPSPVLRQAVDDGSLAFLRGPVAGSWALGAGGGLGPRELLALNRLAVELGKGPGAAGGAAPAALAAAAAGLAVSTGDALAAWGGQR